MTPDSQLHRIFHKKESAEDYLAIRVEELREALRQGDAAQLAARIGVTLTPVDEGRRAFELLVWGKEIRVELPAYDFYDVESGQLLSVFDQAMLAHYLAGTDGMPLTGTWVSFTDLQDGKFYTQAFQGYTGSELAKLIGDDIDKLAAAAQQIGGIQVDFGDAAFAFQPLPNVAMLVTCWLGDEDFPSSYRILFDANLNNHIPTEAAAILGSGLTRRLKKSFNTL